MKHPTHASRRTLTIALALSLAAATMQAELVKAGITVD